MKATKSKPLTKTKRPWLLPGHMLVPKEYDFGETVRDVGKGKIVRRPDLEPEMPPHIAVASTLGIDIAVTHMLRELANRARAGDTEATASFARITAKAVSALEIVSRENQGIEKVAAQCHSWPVMKSARTSLSEDEKDYFARIGLGKESLVDLEPQCSKWVNDDAAGIAYSLVCYIEKHRANLPNFRDSTAPQWWEVARELLLFAYPEPESIRELSDLVTAPTKRKSPGRIRQAILDKLKARMCSLPW